jgi:hypothetical protein
MTRSAAASALLLCLAACADHGPAARFELLGVSHYTVGAIDVELRLVSASGEAPTIRRGGGTFPGSTVVGVELVERPQGAPPEQGTVQCQGSDLLQPSQVSDDGVVQWHAQFIGGACHRAAPGDVVEVRVSVTSPAGVLTPQTMLAPPELQPEP